MQRIIPYKKLLRLACITSPLFGLLGATPALVMGIVEYNRIPIGFVVITILTFLFWLINIYLLKLSIQFKIIQNGVVRYVVSFFSVFFLVSIFYLILTKFGLEPVAFSKELPIKIKPSNFFIFPLLQAQSINIITIVLLELTMLRDEKMLIQQENSLLKVANLEAKHNQLKQQLHPHFLFNSLSTLRSLIKRSPVLAEEYLEKLANILRFSINTDTQTIVSLQEEKEFVHNYLQMQQVRFGNALTYKIALSDTALANGKVPVYSIQLLIENAIKHNILTINSPLHILVADSEVNKTISITNNVQPKLSEEKGSGVGLINLAERYRLLGDQEVEIHKDDKYFKVTIKLL